MLSTTTFIILSSIQHGFSNRDTQIEEQHKFRKNFINWTKYINFFFFLLLFFPEQNLAKG